MVKRPRFGRRRTLFFVGNSVFRFVVAVRILRGRHRLAFADVDGVHHPAFFVDYLVGPRLGTGIAAIQSHLVTSDTAILCREQKKLPDL